MQALGEKYRSPGAHTSFFSISNFFKVSSAASCSRAAPKDNISSATKAASFVCTPQVKTDFANLELKNALACSQIFLLGRKKWNLILFQLPILESPAHCRRPWVRNLDC